MKIFGIGTDIVNIKRMEKSIKKRKRGRKMNITPIVINAFYGKKSNTKTNSLKVIHDLKKVQLY